MNFLLLPLVFGSDPVVLPEPPKRPPIVKPAEPPKRPPVVKPAGSATLPQGWHTHRCPFDGTTWSHGHENFGDAAAHTCPTCGRVIWGNKVPNPAPVRVPQPSSAGWGPPVITPGPTYTIPFGGQPYCPPGST